MRAKTRLTQNDLGVIKNFLGFDSPLSLAMACVAQEMQFVEPEDSPIRSEIYGRLASAQLILSSARNQIRLVYGGPSNASA
jgi:hypothetical protein